VRIRLVRAHKGVGRVLVLVMVLVERKNNFSLPPRISDDNGCIVITRDEVESTIAAAQKDAPMDYDGPLDRCYGLRVLIESKADLQARLRRLQEFYPIEANKFKEMIGQSSNEPVASVSRDIIIAAGSKDIEVALDDATPASG